MLLQLQFRAALCAVVILAASVTIAAQPGRPAAEYRSLLNIDFAEANGELLVDGLHIVFPPPRYEEAVLIVSTTAGEQVAIVPLRLESYFSFPVFSKFVPETRPTVIKLGRAGEFVVSVKIAGEVISRFPFTLLAEPDADPYSPPKRFRREGVWRDVGYVSLPANVRDGNLRFNWWMSVRELPAGLVNPAITVHLIGNHKEVAASRERIRLDRLDWQFFSTEFTIVKKSGSRQLTMSDLVNRDVNYLLIVKADGIPIKSFQMETKAGRLQRAEQSHMSFEPHGDFMSPRFIQSRGGSDFIVADAYWVRRSGVVRSFPATLAATSIIGNQ